MKKVLCLICILAIAQCSFASSFNKLETREQAYERQSQQNYVKYQNNNYQPPLGGYSQPLGGSAGRQYGYVQPPNLGEKSSNNYNYSNSNYNQW